MNIRASKQNQVQQLFLEGRLDTNTSPLFTSYFNKLIEQGETLFLFDFSNLEYISSAGLRVLLSAGKIIKSKGGSLVLCALNENVFEVFEITGFTEIFEIKASLARAMEEFD